MVRKWDQKRDECMHIHQWHFCVNVALVWIASTLQAVYGDITSVAVLKSATSVVHMQASLSVSDGTIQGHGGSGTLLK